MLGTHQVQRQSLNNMPTAHFFQVKVGSTLVLNDRSVGASHFVVCQNDQLSSGWIVCVSL